MSDIQTVLRTLSLSPAEIELYLFLLHTPGRKIADIVHRTQYHRPRVMKILNRLEEHSLVTHTLVGKRKIFSAAPPHTLVERAENIVKDIRNILPELIKQQPQKTTDLTILTGEEGLSACFFDVVLSLDRDDVFYRISSASDQQYVDSLVPDVYREMRDAKKLERKVITSRYVGVQKKKRLERPIRFFDEDDALFEHNVIQFIYGEKISLLDFNSRTGTIIKNKAVADFQKSIFLTLYKKLQA